MPPAPQKTMKIREVAAYVQSRFGIPCARQTAYNWVNKGKDGVKLRSTQANTAGQIRTKVTITTQEWVDEYVTSNILPH